MKTEIKFESLEEAISCYGRENLIPIDNLKQAIFYIKHGCQPRFVWEREGYEGRITFWFLKRETSEKRHLFIENGWRQNRCECRKEI